MIAVTYLEYPYRTPARLIRVIDLQLRLFLPSLLLQATSYHNIPRSFVSVFCPAEPVSLLVFAFTLRSSFYPSLSNSSSK
jgi:hypothetical protein